MKNRIYQVVGVGICIIATPYLLTMLGIHSFQQWRVERKLRKEGWQRGWGKAWLP